MGEVGAGDVFAGDFGVGGVGFEGDELAGGWEGAGEPDGAVGGEGSDFEDAGGVDGLGEEVEEFSLIGGDVDVGKVGGGGGLEGGVEGGVGWDEVGGEVVVDGGPLGLGVLHDEVLLLFAARGLRSAWKR